MIKKVTKIKVTRINKKVTKINKKVTKIIMFRYNHMKNDIFGKIMKNGAFFVFTACSESL